MKIGILREEKQPFDKRVALTPSQCMQLMNTYSFIDIVVMTSSHRCYSDQMYTTEGVKIVDNLEGCDILIGIKEVPISSLIANKTYLFFSHTIKKQRYNHALLSALVKKNIRLIDYEVLKKENGRRLIGFGRYAGVVGAYNSFLCYGLKSNRYNLKPAYKCRDRAEMNMQLQNIHLKQEKIIVTGKGRVGRGIVEVISSIGIKQVSKEDFLSKSYNESVYVHLDTMDYNERIDGGKGSKIDFYENSHLYNSSFLKFANVADIFIAGHYYKQGAPFLFTREDAKKESFNLSVVADISCDIDGPVASTIRSSTIEDPIYGYSPELEQEDDFKKESVIAVMAVDNLPCELPKDASLDFGHELINIIPLLFQDNNQIIMNATICDQGDLTYQFEYLRDFLNSG